MITSDSVDTILLPLAFAGGGGFSQFVRDMLAPPPLHPILVHFAAALIPLSFCFDALAWWNGRQSLRSAAAWTLFVAGAATPLVAASGWLWLWQMQDMDHSYMTLHQWLGTTLAVLCVPLAVWRGFYFRRDSPPGIAYLATFLLFVLAVTLQGHVGGMMTFGSNSSSTTTPLPAEHEHPPATQTDDGWKDRLDLKD